jgi:hypothetical protein
MATGQMKAFARKIMFPRKDPETAERIAGTFVEGHWTQDHPIPCEEARGCPSGSDCPGGIYEFMDLFPQTMQRRPSVRYIQVPCKRSDETKKM